MEDCTSNNNKNTKLDDFSSKKIEADDSADLSCNCRLCEDYLESVLKLISLYDLSEKELIDHALSEAVRFTGSDVGYFHLMKPNDKTIILSAWSNDACRLYGSNGQNSHTSIENAGIWADAFRLARPVIHNDYEKSKQTGSLPLNHYKIIKHAGVPIFENEKNIVGMLGVCNKITDYNQNDIDQLYLFARQFWLIIQKNRHERSLKKAYDDIEKIIKDRTDELEKANKQLREEIVERKKLQKKLRENETRFKNLFWEAPLAYQSLDEKGNLIDVNQKWLDNLGYIKEEVIGKNFSEFLKPEWKEHFRDNFSRFNAIGEVLGVEFEMVTKDGREILAFFYGKIGNDDNGRFKQTHCIFQDITERRKMENTLKLFEKIVSSSSDFIAVIDENHVFQAVNEAYMKAIDYTADAIVGRHVRDVMGEKNYQKAIRTCLESCLSGNDIHFQEWCELPTGLKYLDVKYFPYKDEHGCIAGVVINIRDNTRLKLMEDEIRKSEKSQAIGTLTGGIAHEFNNILSIILGNAELSITNDLDKETLIENINQIYKAGIRAREAVHQLLGFIRKTDDKDLEIFSLSSIIKNGEKLIGTLLPENVDIHIYVDTDNDSLSGNPGEIRRLLIKMAENAGYAMKKNGGKLRIGISTVEIPDADIMRYPGLSKGNYVKMTIEDTGEGISQDIMDRIFDPYFTTKSYGENLGMGLFIVKGIVKKHRGKIFVTSEPGKTVFEIFFPSAGKLSTTESGKEVIDLKGSESILIVDDEDAILTMMSHVLKRWGYDVFCSSNGKEALNAFLKNPNKFDLIITDLTMPVMTGENLCCEIKKIRPDLPVILYTGFTDKDKIKKARRMGVHTVLEKPAKHVELSRCIRDALKYK